MNIRLIFFNTDFHDPTVIMANAEPIFEHIRKFAELEVVDVEHLMNNPAEVAEKDDVVDVCFIASGGTEEKFKNFNPTAPIILSNGYNNSFAASMEIVSYLKSKNVPHKFINIPFDVNEVDLKSFLQSAENENKLSLEGANIGLIGGESAWLISSHIDKEYITKKYKVNFIDIDIKEVIDNYNAQEISDVMDGANKMTHVLEEMCSKYQLDALTIKCFDLLGPCQMTCCLALAQLNDKGIVCGCEGDIPAVWTMLVAKKLYGKASFMANPSSSSAANLSIDFAHCTIPLSMVESYELPSHYESKLGIAIAGQLPLGRYSILKIGGPHLDQVFSVEGEITANTNIATRCRTQISFKFDSKEDFQSFMDNRLGNHVVLIKKG